jgi:putative hydrolase of the HAD superfamily
MIKAIIFDLDDTLYLEKYYLESGFMAISRYIHDITGVKSKETFKLLKDLNDIDNKFVFNRLINHSEKYNKLKINNLLKIYREHKPLIKLEKEAITTLINLKKLGYRIGIITDGTIIQQNNKIKSLRLKEYIDEIIITDELGKKYWKPHPKAFEIMKYRLNVKYIEMIYIGDNPQKDFYINSIHPIKTVRLKGAGFYKDYKYYKNHKENYSINKLSEIFEIIENEEL